MKTMPSTRIATAACILCALLGFPALSSAETVRLYFDPVTPQIAFAAGDIEAALERQKHTVQNHDLAALATADSGRKIVLAIATDQTAAGQRRATDRPSFFGLNQANSILHGSLIAQVQRGCNARLQDGSERRFGGRRAAGE